MAREITPSLVAIYGICALTISADNCTFRIDISRYYFSMSACWQADSQALQLQWPKLGVKSADRSDRFMGSLVVVLRQVGSLCYIVTTPLMYPSELQS